MRKWIFSTVILSSKNYQIVYEIDITILQLKTSLKCIKIWLKMMAHDFPGVYLEKLTVIQGSKHFLSGKYLA